MLPPLAAQPCSHLGRHAGASTIRFRRAARVRTLRRVRILLSNDDGILAPGLAALHAALRDLGELTVIAPESGRSAVGHGITVHKPLIVQHVPPNGPEEFAGISVDGNPADCVRLAVRTLLAHPPQLVCTGINAGANVGINVFYSGTVAAAAEAAMLGLPGVAFSADTSGGEVDYPRAAAVCRSVLDRLLAAGLRGGELINVNVPVLGKEAPPVRVAPQSRVEIEDTYEAITDENGRQGYHLGSEYAFAEHGVATDVALLAAGCITVTPLRVDMTDHARLDALRVVEAGADRLTER